MYYQPVYFLTHCLASVSTRLLQHCLARYFVPQHAADAGLTPGQVQLLEVDARQTLAAPAPVVQSADPSEPNATGVMVYDYLGRTEAAQPRIRKGR